MDTKLKNSHRLGIWIIIAAVLAASAVTIGLYPYMNAKAKDYTYERTTRMLDLGSDYSKLATQVMNFSYEIWHQEKQEEEGRVLTYSQTFLPGLEEKIKQLREEEYGITISVLEEGTAMSVDDEDSEGAVTSQVYMDGQFDLYYYENLQGMMDNLGKDWARFYQKYTPFLSYAVIGEKGEFLRSNVNNPEQFFRAPLDKNQVDFAFTVDFSSTGSLKISDFTGASSDETKVYQAMSHYEFYDPLSVRLDDDYHYSDVKFSGPRNIKIMFRCMPENLLNGIDESEISSINYESYIYTNAYHMVTGCIAFVIMVLALALPAVKRFEIGRSALCRLSFEPLSLIGTAWLAVMAEGSIPAKMIASTVNGSLKAEVLRADFLPWAADIVVVLINLFLWAVAYGMLYWGITCYRAIFTMGLWRYFKERTWLGRFLRFIKRWVCNALNVFNETDWESRSTKIIGKAVIGNFVILTLISCLWFWGIGALIIYSFVLFFMLRKYWSQMQQKYNTLLDGINQIAEGNLDVEINEDLGVFNPFKAQLSRIQEGFKKAVAQEVKSEKTKSELITNVSHDLKTPLTAIITYINLLKQDNITQEERDSYIQVLDQKSMRLKVLIEDLFEVSKASSGTVTLHPANVDIISLIKQVRLELSDKMEASGIEFRFNLPEERVVLYLDSQKTYRIFENLLVNIAKYGMPGTRAYIQVVREEDGYVSISMRNVSARELNVSPEELTERFVRGDSSRNTEGSGLGLAIARSFVEVQNGTMKIEVEDDLFRVVIRWKENVQENNPAENKPDSFGSDGQNGSDGEKESYERPDADRQPMEGNLWSPEENQIITGEWSVDQEDETDGR